MNLNLEIDLGRNFHFQGAGIDSRLAGRLRLIADSRNPLRANGSVHTVGGTFDAYGRESKGVRSRFVALTRATKRDLTPVRTIGKRIGSNAVLSYERSLTSAENILKLTVDLGRGLSVVGRVGANNAIGLLYTFTFGGGPAASKENR